MVRPNCRDRLTAADFDFVADTLARRPEDRGYVQSLLADPETRDLILDHDDLFSRIMCTEGLAPFSAYLFFYVLVRRAFLRHDLYDTTLADYCASLLVSFVGQKPPEDPENEPYRYAYLIDHLAALSEAAQSDVFFLHNQLGNYALFLSGMFPNYVRYQAHHRFGPSFRYYEQLGAMSYHIASQHEVAHSTGLSSVLEGVAMNFRPIRKALNHVSEGYLRFGATLEHLVIHALENQPGS